MVEEAISEVLPVLQSTVSRILRRYKMSNVSHIEPPPPPYRWQRRHGGELIHIDSLNDSPVSTSPDMSSPVTGQRRQAALDMSIYMSLSIQ